MNQANHCTTVKLTVQLFARYHQCTRNNVASHRRRVEDLRHECIRIAREGLGVYGQHRIGMISIIVAWRNEKMPCNPFHRLRTILDNREVSPEIAVRALMATVYSDACNDCNEKLRNEDFLKAFEHMIEEMLHVQALSRAA